MEGIKLNIPDEIIEGIKEGDPTCSIPIGTKILYKDNEPQIGSVLGSKHMGHFELYLVELEYMNIEVFTTKDKLEVI